MHVCDLQVSVHLNMFCFIWRCLHDACSTLFQSFFAVVPSTRTRGGQSNLLVVPPASIARSAKRLTHAGAIMWNRLPPATLQQRFLTPTAPLLALLSIVSLAHI